MRRPSEESVRMEDCDGPILDAPTGDAVNESESDTSDNNGEALCTDRAELIERIKRGESPTWVPNQALKQEYLKTNSAASADAPRRSPPKSKTPSSLLPAAELKSVLQRETDPLSNTNDQQPDIRRPRSALHAGDFTKDGSTASRDEYISPHQSRYSSGSVEHGILGTSPTTPWYTPSSSFHEVSATARASLQEHDHDIAKRRSLRNRAPSLNSYSSSNYVLRAPTTPLVQQSNNADLDFPARDRSVSPDKGSRRHTLPPNALHNMHASFSRQLSDSYQQARHPRLHRREGSFPHASQSRRSLTSNWSLQPPTSPQTPTYLRSRRSSFSSEASPLQHASMVGSYEESILRGWMSTAPSKPLDFTAQIGVLGKGNCKPKCPAHVTIPFPAVFYNWASGNGRNPVNDDPSPYVGHIDLQYLSTPMESKQILVPDVDAGAEHRAFEDYLKPDIANSQPPTRKAKRKRRTSPSHAPPSGSYRIPQQGQLQIIIKNPNKTAVKLFLVPYDLSDMEPGTKTFVRQRSYSADPVIDSPHFAKAQSDISSTTRKPTLRYLIHLNICSPSKGRFYLYQQIRVVFANRVPDNKEKLCNEIQVPQPKYSTYKPNRESISNTTSSAGAKLAAEKAFRRRSAGFGFNSYNPDGHGAQAFPGGSTLPFDSGSSVPPIPAIPFKLPVSDQRSTTENANGERDAMDVDMFRPTTASDMPSPLSNKANLFDNVHLSSSYKSSSSHSSDGYNKLSKGDSGYGGFFGRPQTPEPGEGLLARRLKGLGVQRDPKAMDEES